MAYVVVYDRRADGEIVPIMSTDRPEIVAVIERLVSRELFQAAYASPGANCERRKASSKRTSSKK